jgi:hypothetical protein
MNPKRRPTQKLRRRGGSQGLKLRKGDDPLSRDHGVGGGRNPADPDHHPDDQAQPAVRE